MANETAASRVALVTGGASGIGLATSKTLLAAGWRVAAVDRDAKAIAALGQELGQGLGQGLNQPDATYVATADVCDEAGIASLVEDVVKRFGRLDGVVNSAGIGADVPALETSVDLFRRCLDVNVVGSFIVARAAALAMKAAGTGGAIVNIASISGLRGSKGRVAYGASKGAVVTMTQVLANDLAQYGIRVNAIAPGPIDTPMVEAFHTQDDRNLYMRYIPLARYGTPQEIADAIAFLLDGTKAAYITGEILAVDGGYRGAGIIPGRK